jgi:hypothetical protein
MPLYLDLSLLDLILKLLASLSYKENCFCFLGIKLDYLLLALLNSYTSSLF